MISCFSLVISQFLESVKSLILINIITLLSETSLKIHRLLVENRKSVRKE